MRLWLIITAVALVGGVIAVIATTTSTTVALSTPTNGACRPLPQLATDPTLNLTDEQLGNAALIIHVGRELSIPPYGMQIAVATAMQESRLRNLPYGDRDSLGLFQQRPSMGWGTREQIMDPRYSSTMFYTRLQQVPGWQDMQLWEAAQAVQRSGFPYAYQQWAQLAAELVQQFGGGLACVTPGGPHVEKAIQYATQQIGDPYLWGATGPDAYDCSGLMLASWAAAGVTLNRTSREQWRNGDPFPLTHAARGDLLFWSHDGTPAGIHHVAMYLGDGTIIEAQQTGCPRPHQTDPGHTRGERTHAPIDPCPRADPGAGMSPNLAISASPGPILGSLCTGYGGLDLGVLAAFGGGRVAWCADTDPHVTQILAARMPGVPNLGDVRAIDWTAVEPIDIVTVGFPCQDISAAGRRVGIEKGERSGLWTDIMAGVRVLRPPLLIVENVAALRWRNGGLHRVLGDLAETGYDALWRSVRATEVGAAHQRERVFLLAWPRHTRDEDAPHADRTRRKLQRHQRRESPGRPLPAGPTTSPANAPRNRRHQRVSRPTWLQGRLDAAVSSRPTASSSNGEDFKVDQTRTCARVVDWGVYTAAIDRWERRLGRPVPPPTQPGQHGRPVLAPAFVEHLMGLPQGWVTALRLPRTAQLRALGNGVVPQQAARAIALLLNDLHALLNTTPLSLQDAA